MAQRPVPIQSMFFFFFLLSFCHWFGAASAAQNDTCSSHPGSEVPCPDEHKPVSKLTLFLAIGIPVIIVTVSVSTYLFFVFRRKAYSPLSSSNRGGNHSRIALASPPDTPTRLTSGGPEMASYQKSLMTSSSTLTLHNPPEHDLESQSSSSGAGAQQQQRAGATPATAGAYYGYSVAVI